jgi:hypothetical protein
MTIGVKKVVSEIMEKGNNMEYTKGIMQSLEGTLAGEAAGWVSDCYLDFVQRLLLEKLEV